MKTSLNWLKQYVSLSETPTAIGERLTSLGLEVEGMDVFESVKGGLKGLVIGYVKTCTGHPDADKLSVTTVDIGTGEDQQIVCGAPNVAAGQKVVVATVGTTLYSPDGSSFEIKKAKIRGVESHGMICAEDEIGLGASHAGIMVLPETVVVGTPAADYFEITSDIVYEIGLTPNRSDATCHLGVAKDLAASLISQGMEIPSVAVPAVDGFKVDHTDGTITVKVENAEACPRYTGVSIMGLKVGPSPAWLQNRLNAVGVRPINNVVDATNYVLHELGQPLHAFDLDKIAGRTIIVKTLPKDTPFLALDERKFALRDADLMICDGESKPMCIGGVFGGFDSGVTAQTTGLFLEAAHFEAGGIRRTSMSHNLRTDAAKVFEKGSDPNVTLFALKRAALLIQSLAGGTIASDIIDLYPHPVKPVEVKVAYQRVNQLIGTTIDNDHMRLILKSLEMDIVADDNTHFTVAVPTNKVDVTRESDIVEEILRVYGLNQVAMPEQFQIAQVVSPNPDPYRTRQKAKQQWIAMGCQEMMALSLSESRYYSDQNWIPKAALVYINNTSNVQLDIMRPDVLMSGLEAIRHNQNRQQSDVRLFEFGKTYQKTESGFDESQHISVFITGKKVAESWLSKDNSLVDYYTLKAMVDAFMLKMGMGNYQQAPIEDDLRFAYGSRYFQGQRELVRFGMVAPAMSKGMDVKAPVFFADILWDNLFKAVAKSKVRFTELNKYPTVRRDVAFVVNKSVTFDEIAAIARKTGKKLLSDIQLFDVYTNDEQLGADKKSYAVSMFLEDPTQTLQDKEVDKVVDKVMQLCETQLGATIRR